MSSTPPVLDHQAPASPSGNDDNDYAYANELTSSIVLTMLLEAAVQMDLFEILAEFDKGRGLAAEEIAAKLSTSNPEASAMLDRMLYLLATHDILKCSVSGNTRAYSLAPVAAKYFVKNETGMSLVITTRITTHDTFIQSCNQLKSAVLEGGAPFGRANGMTIFQYMSKHREYNQMFNEVMHNHASITMSKLLDEYTGFEKINHLVDVAGGFGNSLGMITSKYPHIKGINFDLPHVIAHAPSYPGVEHIGGDMFESIPSSDAIFLKWILHNWNDEDCTKLLKICYKALPENGKVIVVESNLPEVPDNSRVAKSVSLLDMIMMVQSPGGKERTGNEFLMLAKGAGFSGITHVCFFCNHWVMEFYK